MRSLLIILINWSKMIRNFPRNVPVRFSMYPLASLGGAITKIPNQKMTKKIRVRICSFFRALRCGLWHLYQRPWIRWVNQLQRFVFFRIFIFLKIYKKSNRSFKKVFNDVLQMKNQRWRICSFFRALRRGLWHLYQRPWKSGLI